MTGALPGRGRADALIFRRMQASPQELAPCAIASRGLPRLQRACPSAGLDEQCGDFRQLPGLLSIDVKTSIRIFAQMMAWA